jgi:hypothetical protein
MGQAKLPVLADFSQATIDSEVSRRVRNNPVTLGLGVVGFGSAALPIGWFGLAELPLVWIIVAACCLAGSGVSLIADQRVGRRKYARRIVRQRQAWLAGETDRLVARLRTEFSEQGRERQLGQLEELETSYADLRKLLSDRFSAQGMAMDRFAGQAIELRDHVLAQLVQTQDLLAAVASIPVERLRGSEDLEDQARVGHYDEAVAEVEDILDGVGKGLTRLSGITLEVARVGSTDSTAFNRCLAEVARLTDDMLHFKREVN